MEDYVTEDVLAMSKIDLIERERQKTALYILKQMQTSKYYYCGLFDYNQFTQDMEKHFELEGEL